MRILRFIIWMVIILSPTVSYSCGDEEKNEPRTDYISEYNAYENISDNAMDISDTSYDFSDYGVTDNNISGVSAEAMVATGIWSQNLAPVDNALSSVSSFVDENAPEDTISASSPDISVLSTGMAITPLQ